MSQGTFTSCRAKLRGGLFAHSAIGDQHTAYRFVTTFVLLMLTAGITLNAHAQGAESSDRPPNVVLILADDI